MVTREYALQALDAKRFLVTCRISQDKELVLLLSIVFNDACVETLDVYNVQAALMQINLELPSFISKAYRIVIGDDASTLDLFDSSDVF